MPTRPILGYYIPGAINTELDIDGDGQADVYFYEGSAPTTKVDGIQYILANNVNGLQINGTKTSYLPIQARYWAADGHLALAALGSDLILEYEKHGYTLTQNPGY